MTRREFFTAVANGTINADVTAMAKAELEKFAAEDKERDSKRQANIAIGEELLGKLETGKEYLISEMVALMGGTYNSSKIGYIVRTLMPEKFTIKDTTPKTYIKK